MNHQHLKSTLSDSIFNVSEIVKSEQIKNYTHLLATVEIRKNAGQTHLADYIFNRAEKNLQKMIKKPGKW